MSGKKSNKKKDVLGLCLREAGAGKYTNKIIKSIFTGKMIVISDRTLKYI